MIVGAANELLSAERAREVKSAIADAALIVCQREVPDAAMLEAFKIARAHKTPTLWNPAPVSADFDRDVLAHTDIVFANETETEVLINAKLESLDNFKDAAKRLLTMGPRVAVITLGARGAILAQQHDTNELETTVEHIECPERVKVVDTTGAGDCCVGTFAQQLVAPTFTSHSAALRKAVHVAALSVTRSGINYFTFDELKEQNVF